MSQRRTDNNKMASRNQRNATANLERGLAQAHMIPWEKLWKFDLLDLEQSSTNYDLELSMNLRTNARSFFLNLSGI